MTPLPFLISHGALVWGCAALAVIVTGLVAPPFVMKWLTRRARRAAKRELGSVTETLTRGPITLEGALTTTQGLRMFGLTEAAAVGMVRDARAESASRLGESAALLNASTSIALRGDVVVVAGQQEQVLRSLKEERFEALGLAGGSGPFTLMSIPRGAPVRVRGTLQTVSNATSGESTYREPNAGFEMVGTEEDPIRVAAVSTRVMPTQEQRALSLLLACVVFVVSFVVVPEIVWQRARTSGLRSEASALALCATPFHRGRGLQLLNRLWGNVASAPELDRLVSLRSLRGECDAGVGHAYLRRGQLENAREWARACDDGSMLLRLDAAFAEWERASERAHEVEALNTQERRAVGLIHLLSDESYAATRLLEGDEGAGGCAFTMTTPGVPTARCALFAAQSRMRVPTTFDRHETPDVQAVRALLTRTPASRLLPRDEEPVQVHLDVPRLDQSECPLPRGALGIEFVVLEQLVAAAPTGANERGLIAELAARRAVFEHVARRPAEAMRWATIADAHATQRTESSQVVGISATTPASHAIRAIKERLADDHLVPVTSLEIAFSRNDTATVRALLQNQPLPFRAAAFLQDESAERMAEITRYSPDRPRPLWTVRENLCDVSARLAVAERVGDQETAAPLAERLRKLVATLADEEDALALWAFRPILSDPVTRR